MYPILDLEEDIQDRHHQREGDEVEQSAQDVEAHRQRQEPLVMRRYEAANQNKYIFHLNDLYLAVVTLIALQLFCQRYDNYPSPFFALPLSSPVASPLLTASRASYALQPRGTSWLPPFALAREDL